MDARAVRSRAKLRRAVLELARDTPVAELSVTRVARAAAVHRSTFYEHASSPDELLRTALVAELDGIRDGLLAEPGRDIAEVVQETTRRVLEHVHAHAPVYRRGLGSGELAGLLGAHFEGSARLLLDAGRLSIPLRVDGVADDVLVDGALRFVARGTVGVIQTWLELPGDPGVDVAEAMYRALLPSWWTAT
jgi:AcrR family transcriptional regulator